MRIDFLDATSSAASDGEWRPNFNEIGARSREFALAITGESAQLPGAISDDDPVCELRNGVSPDTLLKS